MIVINGKYYSDSNELAILIQELEVNLALVTQVAQAADELMSILGAYGEIDTRHPKTQSLLTALYAWRPVFQEASK